MEATIKAPPHRSNGRGHGHQEEPLMTPSSVTASPLVVREYRAGTGVKVQKSSLGSKTVSVPLSGASCKVCGNPAVNAHHVCSQSRLKRYLPADEAREAQADIRNTTPLCFDCHEKVESGRLELAPHELHPGFLRFVEQYDLAAALPRYLSERLAA
jgi:hypothetical protein